jgi:hypothetical protein
MEWVVSDDIGRESWRRLQEYANIDLATDYLIGRHGHPKNPREVRNYRKQAEQVRVCIIQAKEYFDAAGSSTLFTSPNHLYYGLLSLSTAQMLLLGSGEYSLDYRRGNPENSSHGLRFSTACTASNARSGLEILEKSRYEVLARGHFISWYGTLPKRVAIFGLHTEKFADGTSVDFKECGGYDVVSAEDLIVRKQSILELLRHFPDLAQDFRRYGVPINAARITAEVRTQPSSRLSLWTFHQTLDAAGYEKLLDQFSIAPRFADSLIPRLDANGHVWAVEVRHSSVDGFSVNFPESRDAMDHETYAYADPVATHEVVDGFLVAYQLSMLARYYPDVWVSCIESHCRGAKLIERAVDTLIKKAPVLTLSLLAPKGLTISVHRAPWK